MRIVILEGVWRFNWKVSRVLEAAIREQFPDATIVYESLWLCLPIQILRMWLFIRYLARTYDDGVDTLFVCHSMGGIFACALDRKLKRTKMAIVTICSPHWYLGGIFPYLLGADHVLKSRIITFRASGDLVVIWGTRHPQTRKHQVIESGHRRGLIKNPAHARLIAASARRHFGEHL